MNGIRFASDSFDKNGDADTQYNTEPYFNELKPRIYDIVKKQKDLLKYLNYQAKQIQF